MKNIRDRKGFAMLFAVLVSSVLLSIGLSIFNLTVKELVLSSSGRESQFAFYAADTGAECAIYWDFKGVNIFATSTEARVPSPSNPDCLGANILSAATVTYPAGGGAETTFDLTIPAGTTSYCATVKVKKLISNFLETTRINSYGYNVCDVNDSNRIERALRVCYGADCGTIN